MSAIHLISPSRLEEQNSVLAQTEQMLIEVSKIFSCLSQSCFPYHEHEDIVLFNSENPYLLSSSKRLLPQTFSYT